VAFTPLNTLNAYLEVARRRSFAGAARELGVSPSALSQSVRQLEARLGVTLLTGRYVSSWSSTRRSCQGCSCTSRAGRRCHPRSGRSWASRENWLKNRGRCHANGGADDLTPQWPPQGRKPDDPTCPRDHRSLTRSRAAWRRTRSAASRARNWREVLPLSWSRGGRVNNVRKDI